MGRSKASLRGEYLVSKEGFVFLMGNVRVYERNWLEEELEISEKKKEREDDLWS